MPESDQYRLFVAVVVPEKIKASIEAAQTELRRALPEHNVRWTRREQFHLTLRFLGDVAAAQVEAVTEAMRSACQGFGPLHLRAERMGCFPERGRPRVVWVGVRDEAQDLPRLQHVVQAATDSFSAEPKEERFAGHLTLARIKGINRLEAEALSTAMAGLANGVFGHWTAFQLELMRSQLLPQGARHTSLASIALAPPPADLV